MGSQISFVQPFQIAYPLNYLKRPVHFLASQKRRILVGLILCIYLNFIVIVLQPFDTSQFEADYKTLLLSGYGILTCFVFVIHGSIENIWYSRFGKIWLVWYEIMTTITFCFLAGTVLYLYNVYIVNEGKSLSTGGYLNFLFITTAGMVPVFVPPMLYLRQKFGERIMPLSDNSITLIGENKNEILKLEKETLLFIKAVENYIEICFIDKTQKVTSKTFRQTLSNVCEQLPFLQKCHRSYLVNTGTIKEIIGNSQGAKITFSVGDKEIPLSKTYYKDIKNSLL